MTLLDAAPADPVSARRAVRDRRPRWGWTQTVVMLIAVVGAGILAYPMAASWFSAVKHDTEVDGYTRTIESIPSAEAEALLEAAREYNADLPSGPLRDPYALGADGQQTAVGQGSDAYFDALDLPGSDAMARIRIPAVGVDLPVFHGTDEDTLARGIGHLYGTALPVGGAGTHSVLTGHNGFVQATLFDDIDQLENGDTIIVSVLGEDLFYEVDQKTTVLPDESEALRPVAGRDHLTLITCTPTGVNTHRLLVRAERVDAPTAAEAESIIADDTESAGFPWWALLVVGVPAAAFVAVRPARRVSGRSRS